MRCEVCSLTDGERRMATKRFQELTNPPDKYKDTPVDFRYYASIHCGTCGAPLKLQDTVSLLDDVIFWREVAVETENLEREE